MTRKSDCPTSLFTAKSSLSGVALTRRPSFGKNRPFIHQYEVKGQSSKPSSAPATPVKVKETGFKRSISFGGGANPKRPAGSERIDTTAAATSKGTLLQGTVHLLNYSPKIEIYMPVMKCA